MTMDARTFIDFCSIQRNEHLGLPQLHRLQEERLMAIVRHAYRAVPYYRRLFDEAGILPRDIRCAADLARIPVTTRQDVQRAGTEAFLSKGAAANRCIKMVTSGETGVPFEYYLSRREYDYWKLLLLRFHLANRMTLLDDCAVLAYPLRFPEKRRWFQVAGILRHHYVNAFDLPEHFTDILIGIRPRVIFGYPGALRLLALELKRRGSHALRPKAVLASAETLDAETRSLIDGAFGVRVSDLYSVIETGPIAWECPRHGGYHINADTVIVECLDREGRTVVPGEYGRVVCTNLFCHTMPMIRYCVDDVAVLSSRQCTCGRALPLLERVEGRAIDFISLPDGRIVSPAVIIAMLRRVVGFAQHRVIQKARDLFIVQLVAGHRYDPQASVMLKVQLERELGPRVRVEVEMVREIAASSSGKFRSVVSEVPADI